MDKFTDEQMEVYNECVEGTNSVFCTGVAGSGKSLILSAVVKALKNKYIKTPGSVAVTASTGSAAYLINGTTLHRFAGVGINEVSVSAMRHRIHEGRASASWKRLEVLIIDEVSMLASGFVDVLSEAVSWIRDVKKPFGGVRLIMFGDFMQLPPVLVSHDSMMSKYLFKSNSWKEINPVCFNLTRSHRQTDTRFTQSLSNIRMGICTESDERFIKSLDRELKYEDGVEPVVLCAKRETASTHNIVKLQNLNTPDHVFVSKDSGNKSYLKQCPVSDVLTLSINCQVMLVRNINSTLTNGSVGTVEGFEDVSHETFPVVKFLCSRNKRVVTVIRPVAWTVEGQSGSALACRIQIPLVLSWAITIHKSQGKTIERLIVDADGIFERGQLYVALSRCPDPANMQVVNFNKRHVRCDYDCVQFYASMNRPAVQVAENMSQISSRSRPARRILKATSVAPATEQEWDNTRALEESLKSVSISPKQDQ